MPYFCIHCSDHPGNAALRAQHYPAHRAYLGESAGQGIAISASGPLVDDAGLEAIGSLFVVEAQDIGKVRAFNAADPFAKAGLWDSVRITRFDLRRGSVG
jgi:uncharacterized protein